MPFLVSREGDARLLTELLGGGPAEDWQLGLYNMAITPAETDTAATYSAHEAAFTTYARKTLTRSVSATTWNPPVLQAPSGSPAWSARSQVAHAKYGDSPQSWTVGAVGDVVHGYFLVGATSGKLILAEQFASPRTLQPGDTLSITPVFEVA
ncbi:hypothetical protein [Planctomyces sp. SH-PL62]|uniref:hypothetical protein n=1 Tax=Planctomyces sp. SH-PL62 TaxID=1636152 RepID=UPI00078B6AFD|nr:hypothetical protein [Planctomyces sp. SH-PL62]AMV37361.1 hypothetical protein VT85_08000 [Planctomyces sp. SH-PL62]